MLALGLGSSIASAATITPTHDVHHITGNTTIDTINPPSPNFCGLLTLIFDGQPSISVNGNVARGFGVPLTGISMGFIYDPNTQLWYPQYS